MIKSIAALPHSQFMCENPHFAVICQSRKIRRQIQADVNAIWFGVESEAEMDQLLEIYLSWDLATMLGVVAT